MVAPQGQAIRVPLPLPSPHKRPWEEHQPHPPHHVSRATLHFEKHIVDRSEPRDIHPGWVERPPKKQRSNPNHAQMLAHPYQGDREEGHPRIEWERGIHGKQQSQSPGMRPPSPPRSTSGYFPATWKRHGDPANRHSDLPPPEELEPGNAERDWRAENNYSAPKEAVRQDNREYPDSYTQSSSQTQPQPRHVKNDSYCHEPDGYIYSSREAKNRANSPVLENRTWPELPAPVYQTSTTSTHTAPPIQQPRPYKRPHSPASPPEAYNYADHYRRSTAQSVKDSNCTKCQSAMPALRDFKAQIDQLQETFGLFGPYQELHMEYSGRGFTHDEIPGFRELHRLTKILDEAAKLAQFVVSIGPVLKEKIACEQKGSEGRAGFLETEVKGLRRKLAMDLEWRKDSHGARKTGEQDGPAPAAEPHYQGYESAKPPQAAQQGREAPPVNDRRTRAYLEHRMVEQQRPAEGKAYHPPSPAYTSASFTPPSTLVEPSNSGRMNRSMNGSTVACNTNVHQNVPTFKVQDLAPHTTMEAKLKKLKDRLEAEISEVDNLTEEKKRLEERCKELEGMVEGEREKRRGVQEMNMRERKQFLGVVEGVVSLGRKEGDESSASRAMGNAGKGEEGKVEEGKGDGTEIVSGGAALKREVERLRERNRVCESALEHIQRETRHMEDTAKKLNESRRGIDLVLGRVLAGGPVSVDTTLAVAMEGQGLGRCT